MGKIVFLFTDKFPFKGGEPFLETEIHYLSQAFDKVIIYPSTGHGTEMLSIPPNVEIREFKLNHPVYLRKLILKHWMVFLKWFVLEFIKSPHRIKYITEFNWNFKRLAGLVNNAVLLKLEFSETSSLLYSYWFNDWASMLAIAKELGLKNQLITRVHLYDFEEEFSSRKYLPFRYVEQEIINMTFPISKYAKNYINDKFVDVEMKLHRLGVKNKGFNSIKNDKKRYTILTCSNLSWYKRPMLLMELMKEFKLQIEWIHFGDGVMKEGFLKSAGQLPINVEFKFMGYVANSEVISYYQKNSVDLVLNVSSFEGIPVSLMEAISFGIPIIGCDICGMPEIVNKQTGVLLELNFEPTQAALKIEEFLELNSRDENFRNGVKEFWKENFDSDKNYGEFVEVLKAI